MTAALVIGALRARAVGLWRAHGIESTAAIFGLVGAWLLATRSPHASWGWFAFLGSNIGWIAFGWIRRHWFLLLQQVGFTASSLWGIWKWIFDPS